MASPAAANPACGATVSGHVVLTADLHCPGGDGLVLAGRTYLVLGGHSITGDGTPGTVGVRASGDSYITGGTVSGFGDGVVVSSGRTIVRHVAVTTNLGDGLRTEPVVTAVIGNVTASDNGGAAIVAQGRTHDEGGNTASGNGSGCTGVTC